MENIRHFENEQIVVVRTGADKRQGDGISFVGARGVAWVQLSDLSDENLDKV